MWSNCYEYLSYLGDLENLGLSSQVSHLPRRSASEHIHPRSQSSDNEDLKKLRKARGAHVVIDGNNVDFPSSPVTSPGGSPAKHVSTVPVSHKAILVGKWCKATVTR